MKAVILAGGLGTRMSEETHLRPKPMVEIGGRPILWHIMKIYSAHGINDFVICLGYKGYMIKEYFANYRLHMSNVRINLASNQTEILESKVEPWTITLVDTGEQTLTGGRLKRVLPYLGDEDFCLTYGDGVANVNIAETIRFHKSAGTLATMTVTRPSGRFGATKIEGDRVAQFQEKPDSGESWINGGFFVLSPKIGNYLKGDETIFERDPLERLASERQLSAYKHDGFWQPMDTLREKEQLESLWSKGQAPWKTW
jgi:glucose-1-phosphate cytidylyltransferase